MGTVACVVRYAGDPAPEPPALDASALDAGIEAAPTEAGASCELALPPARPLADDAAPGTNLRLHFAMVDMWILPRPGDPVAGYDLDGLCTCPGRAACRPLVVPDAAPLDTNERCDGPGGRDNASYPRYLALRDITKEYSEEYWAAELQSGRQTALIEVADYNGGKNDVQVSVALAAAAGFRRMTDAGPDAAPQFDGQDQWALRDTEVPQGLPLGVGGTCTSMLGDCATRSVDRNAYVRDGVLVARIDGLFPWPLGSLPWRVDMRRGYLVARIERQGSGLFALEGGQVAGRVSAKDFLNVYGRIVVPPLTVPLCRSAFFETFRAPFCQALDLPLDGDLDGRDTSCDAMSSSFKFRAVSAQLGGLITYPLDGDGCKGIELTCD